MNKGQVLKVFHSENNEVKNLLSELIHQWPYGFCKQSEEPTDTPENWCVNNILPYKDLKSTKSVITTQMYTQCGYTPISIDIGEINAWIDSGEIYREIEVTGKEKELAYNCWQVLWEVNENYKKEGYEINGTFMTIITETMSLSSMGLYTTICSSFGSLHIPNGCFISNLKDTVINIQVALKPIPKSFPYTDSELIEKGIIPSDLPNFLRKRKEHL